VGTDDTYIDQMDIIVIGADSLFLKNVICCYHHVWFWILGGVSSFFLSIRFYNSCRRLPEAKRLSSLFLHWSGSKFLAVMAACTPSIHVFLGRPLFLLSSSGRSFLRCKIRGPFVSSILCVL